MAAEDAIQRVTKTLSDLLLDRMVTAETITFGPPYLKPDGKARINLFLYAVAENAAFRNEEDPRVAVNGQYGSPPLALELSYLLTTYGDREGEDNGVMPESAADLAAQRILGDAMRVFHDVPIISRSTPAQSALLGRPFVLDPGLQTEFESLRVVPRSMSLDDLSKLWTALKDEFQRSVAYNVSVVRIARPKVVAANPPVLSRTIDVRPAPGIGPAISALSPQSAGALEPVTITGSGMIAGQTSILVDDARNTGFPSSVQSIAALPGGGIRFQIPNDPATWLPGPKLVSVRVNDPVIGHAFTSNTAVLAVLPSISALSVKTGSFNGADKVVIQGRLLGRASDVSRPGDPLVPTVLFGGYAIPAAGIDYSQLPNQLTVTLNKAADGAPPTPAAGTVLVVRIRVNGVESRSWITDPVTHALAPDPAMVFKVI
jgi:hypothetical protein